MKCFSLSIKYFLSKFFHVEYSWVPIDKATPILNYVSKIQEYIEPLYNLFSYTSSDYVLNSFVVK